MKFRAGIAALLCVVLVSFGCSYNREYGRKCPQCGRVHAIALPSPQMAPPQVALKVMPANSTGNQSINPNHVDVEIPPVPPSEDD